MKNHTIITKITEIHQLWMLFDQNGIIYLEQMGKIVAARFIRSWPLKKQLQWLQGSNVYEVRKKNNQERIQNQCKTASDEMDKLRMNFYELGPGRSVKNKIKTTKSWH